jgi:hypothetical protein
LNPHSRTLLLGLLPILGVIAALLIPLIAFL